jgi:PAS domain S-box-containing protein
MNPFSSDPQTFSGPTTTLDAELAALRESEHRFREAIDALPVAIYTTDAQGRLTHFNAAAIEFSGRRPELGTDRWCVSRKLYRTDGTPMPMDECPMAVALTEGRPMDGAEAIAERPDGTRIWFAAYPRPLHDAQGNVVGGVNLLVDLTERKRAEEARARLAAIVESSDDAIVSKTLDGVITSWNPAAERLFGFTATEAVGRSITLIIPPERHEEETQILNRIRKGERLAHYETVRRRRDGALLNISLTVSPVIDAQGRIVGASKIARDITERKQADEALARLFKEAQEANRAKDEFLATLSHELRTPLNSMLGWSHMLRSATLPPETQHRGLESLERNAKAQAQLVEDLLDISRIVSGKLQIKSEEVNLTSVVSEAVDSARPAAAAKGVKLEFTCQPADARIVLTGDSDRLRQIVWNLLSNAIKFTPEGGQVLVDLRHTGSVAKVIVRDTGEGIAAPFVEHVFERFRQADSTVTRRHGGLGLGLAIVRHLAEAHGGSVSAASPGEGRGATFTVRLAARAIPASGTNRPRRVNQPKGTALQGLRVLVVDDQPDARDLIRVVLELQGAGVTTAASAGEALHVLTHSPVDVLIADIGMPEQDGYSLIEAVRALGPARGGDVPAIAATAYATIRERARALEAGYGWHLAKPVDPDQLVAAVLTAHRTVTS